MDKRKTPGDKIQNHRKIKKSICNRRFLIIGPVPVTPYPALIGMARSGDKCEFYFVFGLHHVGAALSIGIEDEIAIPRNRRTPHHGGGDPVALGDYRHRTVRS